MKEIEEKRKSVDINLERRPEEVKKEAYNDYVEIFSGEMEKLLAELGKAEIPEEKKNKIKDYLGSSEIDKKVNMLLKKEDVSEKQRQNLLQIQKKLKELSGEERGKEGK